ncbi:MAG TPA: glycosyl hydrolase [Lachnoclostridium phytofermentans]|uniref:Glycosyl hydrolase n=1 Tax=Lachnoclostridium phytofermentans TaxID=66219 RepID=A0A3D2XBR4_9FIRM|nr:glycoside hydrolase family 3 C-terminal domain-containing protein [Lachnoclostridium sp.]HCL04406.1 glycosyl hydrolase [Lachnoclostridium phytofermentans]
MERTNKQTMKRYEEEAKKLLKEMTLEEKAGLLSGSNFWETKGVERLGVEKAMVTDGPHGLRKQAGSSDHLGINKSVPATCFPTAATTACSFDTELLERMGEALGEECLQENVSVLLGPGVNIKRSPLCGRNFEYFSEDPYLTGEMASALINGIQSKGVGTSMKHFAANNQEARRMVISSVIDERALREIYLAGFETAVKKSSPWTLMCSYNQINGEFSSQNKKLLTGILREEWGFEGAVMTDWGAVVDRVKGVEAGLDLEMPYSGPDNDQAIVTAVQNGNLDEAVLDTAVLRMICLLLAAKDGKKPDFRYDAKEHHKLAKEVAAASCVLLKNNDMLPLEKNKKLAVLGEFAKNPRYQGAGSSRINPLQLENLCDVLKERNIDFTYAPGYSLENDNAEEEKIKEAISVAKEADAVIVCIGLPDSYESEGFDRDHMHLPESHIALLKEAAAVNSNTIVLLFCGSAVEMPWLSDAKALLLLYLGGEAGASAAADILFGDVNPCGRLAESFPCKLEDNPSFANFPGGDLTVEYRESIYVGYRYYDKAEVDVLFPFGYGLSYTTFAYDKLTLTKEGEYVKASLCVKNTGSVAGAEIVQVYVSQKNSSVFKPVRELKGFAKVHLNPGEEKAVEILLDKRAFAYYATEKSDWVVEKGEYTVAAAASSRDIRLTADITLEGCESGSVVQPMSYCSLKAPLSIEAKDFEILYGRELPAATRVSGEPFTINSTLGEIAKTQVGSALIMQMKQQMASMTGGVENSDDGMERMFERMMGEMPIRSLSMFSQGTMGSAQIQGILDSINQESC